MAGHSKWANIKHKKAKEDARRSKLFSKLSKKIMVAVRESGDDPEYNSDLRLAIQKAKDNNMPNENIERAIKRGTGELEGVDFERIIYEGYGPGGAALYLDLMSDNRNRTASEIRHIFSEHGGSLGEEGCVAWMFERRGQLMVDLKEDDRDYDQVSLQAIEAGAEDIELDEGVIEILTAPQDFEEVRSNLQELGLSFSSADIAMIPKNKVELEASNAKKVLRLMEELEDHEDVQEVYSNFDIPDQVMEEIMAD